MRRLKGRGFTLIELLVVIGMIVLLATILLPMVNHAYSQATRASMAADLQVISQALEAYKGDFGDYPRVNRNPSGNPIDGPGQQVGQTVLGAAVLCWALVAPGPAGNGGGSPFGSDGADGPGFRIRGTIGPVKGPYLPPDRFVIGVADGLGVVSAPGVLNKQVTNFDDSQDVLADRNRSPILYFPVMKGAVATRKPGGFVTTFYTLPVASTAAPPPSVFYFDDNHPYLDVTNKAFNPAQGIPTNNPGHGNPANLTRGANEAGWAVMSYRLGDSNHDGVIDNAEVPVTTGPYLLWAAGPDTIFGNDDDVMCDGTQLQQVMGPLPWEIVPRN